MQKEPVQNEHHCEFGMNAKLTNAKYAKVK